MDEENQLESDVINEAEENLAGWLEKIRQTSINFDDLTEAYFDLVYLDKKIDQFCSLYEIYESMKREGEDSIEIDEDGTISVVMSPEDKEETEEVKSDGDVRYIG